MKKILIPFVLVIAILAGLILSRGKVDTGSEIKIGVVYALTGPASVWTEYGRKGLDLAVEEINAAGGVDGRKIILIYEDSGIDPKAGVSAFQKLVDVDKVDAVIGNVWSFLTNPMISVAESKKTVLISPTVMDKSVEKESPYFFTLSHTVASQKEAMKLFFRKNSDVKTIYDLCWNDRWGLAHSELLKEVTIEMGIRIIGQSCTADFSTDYRTEAAKAKAAKPDAVFITTGTIDPALKAFADLKVAPKILTTTAMVEAVRVRNIPTAHTQNVWFMDWPPNQEFIDKFEAKYGKYPLMEAHSHYEIIRSIAQALENNPKSDLTQSLRTVRYTGTGGPIDFTGSDNITVNKAQAKLYTVAPDRSFVEVN